MFQYIEQLSKATHLGRRYKRKTGSAKYVRSLVFKIGILGARQIRQPYASGKTIFCVGYNEKTNRDTSHFHKRPKKCSPRPRQTDAKQTLRHELKQLGITVD